MLDLIVAAALQQAAPDPCHAVPQGTTRRSCPPWRSASRSERFEIFVNPASLARNGATFELSFRMVYAADLPRGGRSGVLRTRYDCANRTSAVLHIITYNAAGAILEDRETRGDERAPQPAAPGTPNGAMLAEYCPR